MTSRVINTKVAGVTFENRQSLISKLKGNEPCRISPEPSNKYDPNAIAIHVAYNGEVLHIGYLSKELAAQIAPYLDGEALMCSIAEITGGFELSDGGTAAYGVRLRIELPEFDELGEFYRGFDKP
jgi:single-stranded-DNA-specific exonuclease